MFVEVLNRKLTKYACQIIALVTQTFPNIFLICEDLSWQCMGQALWHVTVFPLSFTQRMLGSTGLSLLGSEAINSWFPGEREKLGAQRELVCGLFCCF